MISRYPNKEIIHINTRDYNMSNTAIHDNRQVQIEDKNIQTYVSLST